MGMIYKGLTFDGVNSLDYGIYITGEGVYNAPTRDVEMITIAGRNGEYALDKGRFNNISITYNAGTFGQDQTDFAEKISDFRNAILSRVGYKRLEDDYHPDEYRMAVYMNGLEVDPVHYSEAGEFELTFDCKPQRFLKSGETKQTVTSGQELTNPTLFESHPLLEVRGYGAINMGDESVVIHNEPVGRVNLAVTQTVLENTASTFGFSVSVNDPSVYQTGDEITFLPVTVQMKLNGSVYRTEISDKSNMGARANGSGSGFMLYLDIPTLIAESGVDGATYTGWADVTIKTSPSASPYTVRYSLSVLWDDDTNTITYTLTLPDPSPLTYTPAQTYVGQSTARADSTKPSLGDPLYIDLDIGEAYKIEGTVIPINSAVEIPAELPTLKAGANTITYDDTITQLDITPRWWKI